MLMLLCLQVLRPPTFFHFTMAVIKNYFKLLIVFVVFFFYLFYHGYVGDILANEKDEKKAYNKRFT